MVGYQRVVRITMRCTLTAFLLALLLMAEQEARAEPKVITLSCDRTVSDTTTTPLSIDREKMGVVANLNERTVTAAQIDARFDCELERMSAKLESAQVSALLRAAQQGDKKAAVKLQRRIRRLSDSG